MDITNRDELYRVIRSRLSRLGHRHERTPDVFDRKRLTPSSTLLARRLIEDRLIDNPSTDILLTWGIVLRIRSCQ